MLPTIYTVAEIGKGFLSVMAKPVSGDYIDDEFSGFARLGVNKIVCLLECWEQREVGLACEETLCARYCIEYLSFPVVDRGLPDTGGALELASHLYHEIWAGKHVAIHCRAGIGRTGIIAGAVLLNAGMSAKKALTLISQARGVQVPDTEEQEQWLESIYGAF